ncbi:MAG: fimbrillin family protein [Butyricimonas paravirosa]
MDAPRPHVLTNNETCHFRLFPLRKQGDPYTSLSSTSSTAGYPQLTYTVPDDVITQRDLLVSVPLLDQTKTSRNADGKLPLRFRHALSCIVFNAKMTDACDFPVKVTSITLGNFKNKGHSLTTSATPREHFWTMAGDASDKFISDHQQRTTRGRELENNHEHIPVNQHRQRILVLLPQAIDETDEIKVTVNTK